MQALLFERSNLAQTAVVWLLTLAGVTLFGVVLAYWSWIWFGPRAEPRVEPAAAQGNSVGSAGAIFGNVQRKQETAAPTGIAIRLLGVAAASGGRRGYAVVQLDAKEILAVEEGEDVAPGTRLAEVYSDHVILERGGVRETLAWPQKKASVPTSTPAARATARQAAQPTAPRARGSAGRRNDRN
jgi:general secretion pathway protein C